MLEISYLGSREIVLYVAKTKALISVAVTAKLICIFVFAYAKSRFSHDEAHTRGDPEVIGLLLYLLYTSR